MVFLRPKDKQIGVAMASAWWNKSIDWYNFVEYGSKEWSIVVVVVLYWPWDCLRVVSRVLNLTLVVHAFSG
jgi:hypothetical protein